MRLGKGIPVGASCAALVASTCVQAAAYEFAGAVTACTAVCDSIAFLAVGSELKGSIDLDDRDVADGVWTATAVDHVSLQFSNPAEPVLEEANGANRMADNPFTIDASGSGGPAVVAGGQDVKNPRGTFRSLASTGTADGRTLTGGSLDVWLTDGALGSNGAIVTLHFDEKCVDEQGEIVIAPPCFEITLFEGLVFAAGGTLSDVPPDGQDGD